MIEFNYLYETNHKSLKKLHPGQQNHRNFAKIVHKARKILIFDFVIGINSMAKARGKLFCGLKKNLTQPDGSPTYGIGGAEWRSRIEQMMWNNRSA